MNKYLILPMDPKLLLECCWNAKSDDGVTVSPPPPQVQFYTLTLQVRNAPDLVAEAQLNIKVLDENNKSPVFTNIDSGQSLVGGHVLVSAVGTDLIKIKINWWA